MEPWQLSLSLGFNFQPSCLKAITAASCQHRHRIRRVHVRCSSRRPHHSIWNGARLPPWLLPIISYNIWRCGAGSKLQWRSASLHAATHLWEDPPQDEDRLGWQVYVWAASDVPHALTSVHNSAGCKRAPFHFLRQKGWCSVLCFCVWVRNGCTRAWRRWCTATWKEFAPAVTVWYKNSCDSWLFCTRFGRTTVTLKIHIGLILYILSFAPTGCIQLWTDKAEKLLVKRLPMSYVHDFFFFGLGIAKVTKSEDVHM